MPPLRETDINLAKKTIIEALDDMIKKGPGYTWPYLLTAVVEILENPNESNSYVSGLLMGTSAHLNIITVPSDREKLKTELLDSLQKLLKLPEDELPQAIAILKSLQTELQL